MRSGHFTSSSEDPLSQTSSHADEIPRDLQSRRNVSAFKIMTVSRGFTEEGDKLLNYLVMVTCILKKFPFDERAFSRNTGYLMH